MIPLTLHLHLCPPGAVVSAPPRHSRFPTTSRRIRILSVRRSSIHLSCSLSTTSCVFVFVFVINRPPSPHDLSRSAVSFFSFSLVHPPTLGFYLLLVAIQEFYTRMESAT
ncbi:hypothetical protein C8F01DRAFT_775517 [Mycena amicta]|nr:hypothetical protein C8F01DRAFT_775517 [Mycena amicta]